MKTPSDTTPPQPIGPRSIVHCPLPIARLLTLLFLLSASCTAATPAGLKFETISLTIKGKPFAIEVADDPAKHEQGLMNRPSMPADHGMLFVFDIPDTYSFWMKNTLIPLDIIFLDKNARVLEIHKRLPLDETGMGPSTPALFVIELNAGTAEAIGLKRGDIIALPDKYLKTTPASSEKNN